MLLRLSLLAVLMALPAASGCTNLRLAFTYQSHSHGSSHSRCRTLRPLPGRASPAVAGTPHAEWSELRPFRSYVRVRDITPFVHRFQVRFECNFSRTQRVEVAPAGQGEPDIRLDSGHSSTLNVKPTPPELAALARAVRKRVAEGFEGESNIRVEYLGSDRYLQLEEAVPTDPIGDPLVRTAWIASVLLPVNRELTAVLGDPVQQSSTLSLLCSTSSFRNCSEAPNWVPVRHEMAVTTPRLASLTYSTSPTPAKTRADFVARVLAVARQIEAGKGRVPLGEVPAHKAKRWLPKTLRQMLQLHFHIVGRTQQGAAGIAKLAVKLPVADVVYRGARGKASGSIEGVSFEAEIALSSPTPPAAATRGRVKIELPLKATLRDNRGNHEEIHGLIEGTFVVDGSNAAIVRLAVPPNQRHRQIQRRFQLPGEGHFRSFAVTLQFDSVGGWTPNSKPRPVIHH